MGVIPSVPPRKLLCLGLLACFGANFHFGYQLMLLNPTKEVLGNFVNASYESHYGYALDEEDFASLWSLLLCLLTLGAATSLLTLPRIANKLGRKGGLWLSQTGIILSAIPSCLAKPANSFELLMLGRILYGCFSGLSIGLVSLYLNEISAKSSRGFLSTLGGLFVELGFFAASVAALPSLLGTAELWPYLFVLELIPSLLLLAALPAFPESPKFLLSRGRAGDARKALASVQPNRRLLEETLAAAQAELELAKKKPKFSELFLSRPIRPSLFAGVLACILVPFSGILTVDFFTTELLINSGHFSAEGAVKANMAVAGCSIVAGLLSTFTIDKLGRRRLLLFCNGLMLAINILFFVVFLLMEGDMASGGVVAWLYLFGSCLLMFSFAAGPGPIAWFIAAEMVPQSLRAHAAAFSHMFYYGFSIICGFVFFPAYTATGAWAFFLFIVPLAVLGILLWKLLPETKGRSAQEVITEANRRGFTVCGAGKMEELDPVVTFVSVKDAVDISTTSSSASNLSSRTPPKK